MKHRSGIFAAIAAAAMLPAVGFAADAVPAPKADSTPVAAAKEKTADAKAAPSKPAKPEAKCEYVAGSRIRHNPPTDCDHATPGQRSFSAEEIQATGEFNVTDAMRKLDPRLQ